MLHVANPGNKMVLFRVYTVEKEQGCNQAGAGVVLKLVKKPRSQV